MKTTKTFTDSYKSELELEYNTDIEAEEMSIVVSEGHNSSVFILDEKDINKVIETLQEFKRMKEPSSGIITLPSFYSLAYSSIRI